MILSILTFDHMNKASKAQAINKAMNKIKSNSKIKIICDNYFEIYNTINLKTIPKVFEKHHQLLISITYHGKSWLLYDKSPRLRIIISKYFIQLADAINADKIKLKHTMSKQIDSVNYIKKNKKYKPAKITFFKRSIDKSFILINRFIKWNDDRKTISEVLTFIKDIQELKLNCIENAIPLIYERELNLVLEELAIIYDTSLKNHFFDLKPKMIQKLENTKRLKKISAKTVLMVNYFQLLDKPFMYQRAERLMKAIKKYFNELSRRGKSENSEVWIKIYYNLNYFIKYPEISPIHSISEKEKLELLRLIRGEN
jgi:hypothetical protein